ncbi:histidine phosphatase family protein [Sphingobacterium spiritivorum]|uniref:Phosphoglycerate mutase family protein n=1 Tax=Sphingobacterium spiritivorum ATCC 33861 TaxID=525373 RepID=D7VN92_SPHSI|nr:histidine phosphatase family protein [Sphingobacterium spiritivorum]EFK57389.1 phosphoglycerate mutase family protein [Sphingobacterium spiritivorum ATCC 33861]QQT36537.1 histidine phosphatase family protein [Sphingobacterium spiritivorum]WQD33288.1 histidine phosphatase family protein [Sphingobacterium spiritivorum]SUJ21576.1 bifunctional RNase H/acid phosphatase [Sphingobacterium spiritivorum]
MGKVKNIITIQHPESVHHINGMIGSWTDWPLTESGREQASNIAFNLGKEVEGKSYLLYSSPLLRTKETAEIIGATLLITPQFSDALKERSLGKAVGQSVAWLKENIEREELTVFDRCFDDAESRSDVWERLYPFYDDVLSDAAENIILISHGDTLSIFNVMWLGLELEALNAIELYGVSGSISFLQQNIEGKRIIRKLGDTSYMKIMS